MYALGVMALLGLAVLAVTQLAHRYMSFATELYALVLVALGIGAAWLINLNLFALWGVGVRATWIGVTVTGIMVAGIAYFWRPVLGFFAGLSRKLTDEARTIERDEHLRRVA